MPSPSDLAKFKKAPLPAIEQPTQSSTSGQDRTTEELIESLEKKLKLDEKPVKRSTRREKVSSGFTKPKPSLQRTKRDSSKKSGTSSTESGASARPKTSNHIVWQNKATGIFWCEGCSFKSHIPEDATYHKNQNLPKQQKKPYVRKEHLTDRPFKDIPELQALRDSLPEATKYNPGKKPRNKENN